jgi:Zn-dependent M28 family amino/carboxypeptidase
MAWSGSGDVTAPLYAVDFQTSQPGLSTSGCEAADFSGFPAGSIALLQRGFCTFRDKALNASGAGAVGVIIADNGIQFPFIPIGGTLESPQVSLPVMGTSRDLGETLRAGVANGSTGLTVHLEVDYLVETRTGRNVIADTRGGDPSRVIVVGATLGGGVYSPSSNLLSGAATTLEIAEVFNQQGRSTTPKLRFAWFGAQVADNSGAAAYLASLSSTDRSRIKGMVNIGALGAPNFSRYVLDGDNSEFPQPVAPDGSDTIEHLFADYFSAVGLAQVPTSFLIGGQHQAFLDGGIPVGGIIAGTAGIKTAEEQALFGGTSGTFHDPCWLQACDDLDNVSLTALDQMSDAAAHVVLMLSKRNLVKNPL